MKISLPHVVYGHILIQLIIANINMEFESIFYLILSKMNFLVHHKIQMVSVIPLKGHMLSLYHTLNLI